MGTELRTCLIELMGGLESFTPDDQYEVLKQVEQRFGIATKGTKELDKAFAQVNLRFPADRALLYFKIKLAGLRCAIENSEPKDLVAANPGAFLGDKDKDEDIGKALAVSIGSAAETMDVAALMAPERAKDNPEKAWRQRMIGVAGQVFGHLEHTLGAHTAPAEIKRRITAAWGSEIKEQAHQAAFDAAYRQMIETFHLADLMASHEAMAHAADVAKIAPDLNSKPQGKGYSMRPTTRSSVSAGGGTRPTASRPSGPMPSLEPIVTDDAEIGELLKRMEAPREKGHAKIEVDTGAKNELAQVIERLEMEINQLSTDLQDRTDELEGERERSMLKDEIIGRLNAMLSDVKDRANDYQQMHNEAVTARADVEAQYQALSEEFNAFTQEAAGTMNALAEAVEKRGTDLMGKLKK